MSAGAPTRFWTELDQRTGDGLTITLLYDASAPERVIVAVDDHVLPSQSFSVIAPPERARDAFFHPYAYR